MQLSTQLVELLSIDAIPLFLLQVYVLSWLVYMDSRHLYQSHSNGITKCMFFMP